MRAHLFSSGLVAGLTAGVCVYAAKSPTSQLFGPTLIAGSDIHELAFTFDDGPNDPYTFQLLELLARYQVRATFFLVGAYVRRRPDIARAVVQAGHLIGNHTMTHPSLLWESPALVRRQLASCSALIEDATGVAVQYFRPPFGDRRPDVLRTARELGLTPVMWNITAHDWDATDPNPLAARVEAGLRRNQSRRQASNLLLHDGSHRKFGMDRSVTLAATRMLLESWTGAALRFVTVDAWS